MPRLRRAGLALLVLALVALSVVATIQAQPEQAKACGRVERALELYEKARERLLKAAEDRGLVDSVKKALERADALANEARSLLESGNCTEAWAKLRRALGILRSIARKLRVYVRAERRVASLLMRLARALGRLDRAVKKLEEAGYNVTEIKALLGEARSKLEEARRALSGHRPREALAKAREAGELLEKAASQLRDLLRRARKEKLAERLTRYVEAFAKRVERKLEEIAKESPETADKIRSEVEPLLDEMRKAASEGNLRRVLSLRRQVLAVFRKYLGTKG